MELVHTTPVSLEMHVTFELAQMTASDMDIASMDPAIADLDGLEMTVLPRFALTVALDMDNASMPPAFVPQVTPDLIAR